MASRDDVYLAVGRALELCQLLETEIGTTLLCLDALDTKSYLDPDAKAYLRLQQAIDDQTLGRSLSQIKKRLDIKEDLETLFDEALRARNLLAHRFYPMHSTRIFDAEGCARMIAHIDQLREKLMPAYSSAQHLSELLVSSVRLLKKASSKGDA
jgi:hypothetical protein